MDLVNTLESIVGTGNLTTDTAVLRGYRYAHCPTGDIIGGVPDVVVLPQTVEQISRIMQVANRMQTPVVARGCGSSQYGGVAFEGGIVMDMSLMNKILNIDEDNMLVYAEGGCSTYKIMREADKRGLRFPISPIYTSGPQIGAAVATNITGDMISRLGRLGDLLLGLEVVLPSGEVAVLGSGAYPFGYGHYHRYMGGPDVVGLFVNSAGTLGVITKVAVRLLPKPKEAYIGYGWSRNGAEDLAKCMYELQRYGVYDIHLLDLWSFLPAEKNGFIKIPKDVYFIPNIMEAALTEEELSIREKTSRKICEKHGGKDVTDLTKFFMGPPNYSAWDSGCSLAWGGRNAVPYFYCPVLKFPEIYDLWEAVTKKHGFWDERHLVGWFSWADRNAMDPYPIVKIFPEDLDRLMPWWDELNLELTKRGCAQYAIGRTLPSAVLTSLGPAYELMKKVKRCLDPNNIMNPGVL